MSKRARTQRREAERDARKLAEARRKLAALEAGGSPERPVEVVSASTIEPQAQSTACVVCDAPSMRIDEHVVETHGASADGGRRLRVVRVRCPRCGDRREIYFRIGTTLPS